MAVKKLIKALSNAAIVKKDIIERNYLLLYSLPDFPDTIAHKYIYFYSKFVAGSRAHLSVDLWHFLQI